MAESRRLPRTSPREALILEDEPGCLDLLSLVVGRLGFEPLRAGSLSEAARILEGRAPSLALLDAKLPDGTGLELCRRIRASRLGLRPLVLMVTDRRNVWLRDAWLSAGADDCLGKTQSPTRLEALIRARLRRREWDAATPAALPDGLSLDVTHGHASYLGHRSVQPLGRREFALFERLASSYPGAASRDEIVAALLSYSRSELRELALNELVRRLRKKLPPGVQVVTEYGKGYRLSLDG